MDDVTSGLNIGTNISLEPDFNEMVGFTELEVRHLVETYLAAYLSVTDYRERGHADIALEPHVARYPNLQRGIRRRHRRESPACNPILGRAGAHAGRGGGPQ